MIDESWADVGRRFPWWGQMFGWIAASVELAQASREIAELEGYIEASIEEIEEMLKEEMR